jgi:cytidylate kinase
MIVTVDGPGGAGKSTISRILARRLGLPCLNSGYIYRAVTVLTLDEGAAFEDRERVTGIIQGMSLRFQEDPDRTRVFTGDREITSRLKEPDVTPQIYKIANSAHYRSLLVDLQRRFALPHGVVAEGRDMGTVIFPGADYKFYLDASPEERARRQHRELEAGGHARSFADVLSDVLERDRHERQRDIAPLRVPAGALVIQSDSLSIRDVVDAMLSHIKAPLPGRGGNLKEGHPKDGTSERGGPA